MGDHPGQRNLMMRAETRSSSGNSSVLSSYSLISMASDPNKVDLTLAGSDEAHPLLLYTQILLSPRPAIYIESPFPVDIYYGSDTPWKVTTVCYQDARKLEIDHPILLVPRAPLQTAFEHDETLPNAASMTFPPRCVLQYIRKVEIKASLNAWPDTWNALDSINTLKSLSRSLESVIVNLSWEPVVLGASDARLLDMESIQGTDEWIDAYGLRNPERKSLFFNFKVDFVFSNKPKIIVMSNAPDITAPAPVTDLLELMIKAQVSITSLRV